MHAEPFVVSGIIVRDELTRDRLRALMQELARIAPRRSSFRVYLVGGGTAVYAGWRPSSIDADLFSYQEEIFHDIQGIKERLNLNVEFARPEHFVPALRGSAKRHVFLETIDNVSFYHYDPYAQILSKLVRGFQTRHRRCPPFHRERDGRWPRASVPGRGHIGVGLFKISRTCPGQRYWKPFTIFFRPRKLGALYAGEAGRRSLPKSTERLCVVCCPS